MAEWSRPVFAGERPVYIRLPTFGFGPRRPSDRGDVEPIADVIHLPCLELLGAQLAQPAALEDGKRSMNRVLARPLLA
jgi:hypothetical protein